MGGAEGVHHVHIAQGRVLFGKLFVVFLLALVEADVFEKDDFAVGYINALEIIGDQANFLTQYLAEVVGHRFHGGGFVVNAFFRAAEVGHQHDLCTCVLCRLNRRQRGTDASVAGHFAIFYRYVEVFTNQYPLTGEIQIGHSLDSHRCSSPDQKMCQWLESQCLLTSSIRFANPHSLSNQHSTFTMVPPVTRVWPPSTMPEWAS